MHTLEQAVEELLSSVQPIAGAEVVSINDSVGRILVAPVVAAHPLPRFDNSAMDGWALRSADQKLPAALKPIAHIAAGQFYDGEVGVGECARIFTGSPLPRGADAVVMQEDTQIGPTGEVQILDPVKPWENVRFRGEDVKEGAEVAGRGQRITPQLASLLLACGVAQVTVYPVLRVAVLATGSELREPGAALQAGEIHESNRILVASMLRQMGLEPVIFPIVKDELAATVAALRAALQYDAVITCGGVSVGDHDYIKPAIERLGGRVDFWRVAMKPGKPFARATIDGKPIFALPGNPVSAQVTLLLLSAPALLKMSGAAEVAPRFSFGELAEEISNRGDRRHFVRVMIDGEGLVRASGQQASHRLGSLAAANALVDVPPETSWSAGRKVKVLLLS